MDKIVGNNLLVVIAGPTAVGKTALGIELAKHYGSEIISADSRQFYKEMSVGTAKPSLAEMDGVMHHFVNSHSVQNPLNVGSYEQEVLTLLHSLFQRHSIVFLVGGSGLYIKSVCEGLDELPPVLPGIRDMLNEAYGNNGLEPLLDELQDKDPEYYKSVDLHNPQRIIRALEVIRSTGMPFSSYRNSVVKQRPFQILKIGIEMDRSQLYQRIDARMDAMLDNGLVAEARELLPFKNLDALRTVGYQELFEYFEGKADWKQTVFLLKRNSRRYAKRQMTWFKKDVHFKWFEASDYETILKEINTAMGEKSQ